MNGSTPARFPTPSRRFRAFLRALLLTLCAAGPLVPDGVQARPFLLHYWESHFQTGVASWYGDREAGRKTASGAIFNPAKPSAAHRSLPLGTCVRVTRLENNRAIVVPVIDRGPYVRGRVIDLSEAAADALDMTRAGLARVRIDVIAGCAGLSASL